MTVVWIRIIRLNKNLTKYQNQKTERERLCGYNLYKIKILFSQQNTSVLHRIL